MFIEHYASGAVLGVGDTRVNKTESLSELDKTSKVIELHVLCSRRTKRKQTSNLDVYGRCSEGITMELHLEGDCEFKVGMVL